MWLALLGSLLLASCGGGGAPSAGSGEGALALLAFDQEGLDDVALDAVLVLRFSAALDPATVTPASIQIRGGPSFGLTAAGTFDVDGSVVTFEPTLPGRCDLSDGGLAGDTRYRVQLVGSPAAFGLRSEQGRALAATVTRDFGTRRDSDPRAFSDRVPAAAPAIVHAEPAAGTAAVKVADGNRVVLTVSENLQPCSVDTASVRFCIHQLGDPATFVPATAGTGNPSGFATDAAASPDDQTPLDPFTWTTPATQALVKTLPEPQRILADIDLVQSFEQTQIVITPSFGDRARFPENALIVVELTGAVQDFGGSALAPFTLAFTTENLPPQNHVHEVDTRGETPWDPTLTTARIDETAPGLVQGFLLFAGDGDNGADVLTRSLPQSDAGTCSTEYQANDDVRDDFDPAGDVLLDTGSTANACPNATDGSLGVVWEFRTFRIRSGVSVRIVGVNPALILSQGDVVIEAGGSLLVRGDGEAGAPQSDGEGDKTASTTEGTRGGTGVAGGGDGGSSKSGRGLSIPPRYGGHGTQGYYHTTPGGAPAASVGAVGVGGAGHGNTSARWNEQVNPSNRNTPSGGGGGHATAGQAGTARGTGAVPTSLDDTPDGAAGGVYGDASGTLRVPEAGSGGGAGGELRPFTTNLGRGPGGAGGAGGGFVDLTSSGDIVVLGTIDAAGGRGGSNPGGQFNPNYAWNPGTGGGGGGSGGGIRLLTPGDIVFGSSTVVTAAGGQGGAGGVSQGTNPPVNDGGAGGVGRIALEDGNSIISGLDAAAVTPSEGSTGFYRGVFDATRFGGGGTTPVAVSEIFALGPLDPTFVEPVQTDFVVLAPAVASPGAGKTVMLIEARGYQMLANGQPDTTGTVALPTAWHTVGHFTDSGVPDAPTWVVAQPRLADIGGALPAGNTGALGLGHLDGHEYLQLRVTMFLSDTTGASDPGPALDLWALRFVSDQ